MIWILLAGLLLIPSVAFGGTWYDLNAPFNQGASVIGEPTQSDLNLGPRPDGLIHAYSSSTLVTLPDGREGVLHFGGGHYAWAGNGVHFFDLTAHTWERLWDPVLYREEPILPNGDTPRYDHDDDGIYDTMPACHTYDGAEQVGDWIVFGGYGAAKGAYNSIGLPKPPNCHLWKFNLVTNTWDGSLRHDNGSGIDMGGASNQKLEQHPDFPGWVFAMTKEKLTRVNPVTNESIELSISAQAGLNRFGFMFWHGADQAFWFPMKNGTPGLMARIEIASDGLSATRINMTVTNDPVPTGGNPFKLNEMAWAYNPDCLCVLGTTGDHIIWRLDKTGADTVHASVFDETPAGVYPTRHGNTSGSGPYNDFHYRSDGLMVLSHNGDEGPFLYDPELGGSQPPPPPPPVEPVCTIDVDGFTQRTIDPCDDAPEKLDDAAAALQTSMLETWNDPVLLKNGGVVADKRFNRVYRGKGAVTVAVINAAPVAISDILCMNLAIKAQNAACVRGDGTGDTTIERMRVVDSDTGYLGCKEGATLKISDSTFDGVGNDPYRRHKASHGIYARHCGYTELTNLTMTNPTGGNLVQIGGNGIVSGGYYDCSGKCSYAFKMLGDAPDWTFKNVTINHAGEGNKKVFWFNNPGQLMLEDSTINCAPGHVLYGGPVTVTAINSTINCGVPA